MLIAGIGIANTLLSFINQNNMSIAVRKAVGFYSGNIKTLYYLQLFILLFIITVVAYGSSSRFTSKKIMRLALDYHLGNKSINIRKYLSKK